MAVALLKDIEKLFESAGISCFGETALFNPLWGSNILPGKVILLKFLNKLLCGYMVLQVIIDKCFEKMFKVHLKRSVPSICQFWRIWEYYLNWFQ